MPTAQPILIRKCVEFAELQACIAIQKDVWQFDDADLVPLRMFVVAQKIGGQVIGAFNGKELVGFVFSIPGTRAGKPYLHSHMMAVREPYRNSGLGQKLKLAQREDALARNFDLIEWTFDPLEIKNSFLNIAKLGAMTRRYSVNHYGMSSSPLQGGLPTDRLVAEWWLRSKRVTALLNSGAPSLKPVVTIDVPVQVYEWKSSDHTRDQAKQVQLRNREAFLKAFSEGLAVLGYERDAQGNGKFLLGRWDEPWSYSHEDGTP
ncbi:MAG TPA: GNAT family N-acetyltransferase [Terriglobales bacterium]|nr:GNAT family N-acetyltransferase [Terriglobales bacterium]